MAESKKRHNFAKQGPTETKKVHVCLFFVLVLHIKFPNFQFLAQAVLRAPNRGHFCVFEAKKRGKNAYSLKLMRQENAH